jgi:hypothetical protein
LLGIIIINCKVEKEIGEIDLFGDFLSFLENICKIGFEIADAFS